MPLDFLNTATSTGSAVFTFVCATVLTYIVLVAFAPSFVQKTLHAKLTGTSSANGTIKLQLSGGAYVEDATGTTSVSAPLALVGDNILDYDATADATIDAGTVMAGADVVTGLNDHVHDLSDLSVVIEKQADHQKCLMYSLAVGAATVALVWATSA